MVNEIVFNMVSFPRHPIELRPFDFFFYWMDFYFHCQGFVKGEGAGLKLTSFFLFYYYFFCLLVFFW